ncbi:MAG: hypothetical protein U1E76_20185 [Planctomycetota bacterium]
MGTPEAERATLARKHLEVLLNDSLFRNSPLQKALLSLVAKGAISGNASPSPAEIAKTLYPDLPARSSISERVKQLRKDLKSKLARYYEEHPSDCQFVWRDGMHVEISITGRSFDDIIEETNQKMHRLIRCVQDVHSRPACFPKWLCREVVREAEIEANQLARGYAAGLEPYMKCVVDLIKIYEDFPDARALALCGDKGIKEPKDENDYYGGFFGFAKKLSKSAEDVRVCRTFVCLENGTFTERTQRVINMHRAQSESGVMALEIKLPGRRALQMDYGNISDQLDRGFGFVLFHAATRTDVVLHEGANNRFEFYPLRGPVCTGVARKLFKDLCKQAIASLDSRSRKRLQHLLEQLQQDHSPLGESEAASAGDA